jgi:hypothetical protein
LRFYFDSIEKVGKGRKMAHEKVGVGYEDTNIYVGLWLHMWKCVVVDANRGEYTEIPK